MKSITFKSFTNGGDLLCHFPSSVLHLPKGCTGEKIIIIFIYENLIDHKIMVNNTVAECMLLWKLHVVGASSCVNFCWNMTSFSLCPLFDCSLWNFPALEDFFE